MQIDPQTAAGAAASPPEIRAALGFSRADSVSPDPQRAGLYRAAPVADTSDPRELEFHDCSLRDWMHPQAPPLDLDRMGFDTIDLSRHAALQAVLRGVRAAREITAADASAIRRALRGCVFRLSNGRILRLLFIAPEGLIMRVAGPNGLVPDPGVQMGAMNGHDAALGVHGDQDVRGTPLKQMMRGMAPWLFRHQTPDGDNRLSPVRLVNLWIPLDQVTRPLVFMDRRSLDKRRHQLRYALPTESFLDREEETRVNDIWTFLHDDAQRWYFGSDMDAGRAYVFDTLGTPHGSTILPGEDLAERCYRALQWALGDAGGGREGLADAAAATAVPPADCTAALRRAIAAMQALLRAAAGGGVLDPDWRRRAQGAMDRVVRKSLEMRVVALQTPGLWPLNRRRAGAANDQ